MISTTQRLQKVTGFLATDFLEPAADATTLSVDWESASIPAA
ncbi:MAG: hypothetical protein AAGH89_14665 [Verrucomicrobiota bacterium]